MKIIHVINNNVISTEDEQGEIVLSGRGIGFGKKPGDTVDEKKIEKIYRMEDKERLGKLKDILAKVPTEYLRISDETINLARKVLHQELNENIYITLTDHINFAMERYEKGQDFDNLLTNEVRTYYPIEFELGMRAVEMIHQTTGKDLKEDEAASIAAHIISAEMGARTGVAYEVAKTMDELVKILREGCNGDVEVEKRIDDMIPTLKHFIYRVHAGCQYDGEDTGLFAYVKQNYPVECEYCQTIINYVEHKFAQKVLMDEFTYLVIMLRKLNLH